MFTAVPEYTMLDHIESYLAEWTGRACWPETMATLESRLQIPTGDGHSRFATTFTIFTYEVNGCNYSAVIREIAATHDRPTNVGDAVSIQYNPDQPSTFYYSPACQLASRFVAALATGATVLTIASIVYFHTHQ